MDLSIEPLTAERWPDLVAVFGERGEASRCWCTYFRMPRAEWSATPAAERRELVSAVVAAGREPGLLAYRDGEPVGWVSVAPREEFLPHLERTRLFAAAGFTEIDRRGTRPVYRLDLSERAE